MNYVEHLNFYGVEAKEIPCVKGAGAPTTATVGAVGLLYMDTNTGKIYKCTSATEGEFLWVDINTEVAQETGTSTVKVMSQKAVTEKLNVIDMQISRNDKRIKNFEAGIPAEDFVIDSSTAYRRDVPTNALPFAEVTEIGGVTRKCAQLFDVAKAQIGYRCNNDGSLVKNTSYATSDYIEVKSGTSYYLTNVCGNNYCSAVLFDANKAYVNITSLGAGGKVSGVLNLDSNIKYIRINIFTDVVDINTVMVNEGSTALPYEPYFEGLRSAPVYEVVSEGANLFDIDKREFGTIGNDGNLYITNLVSDFYRFDAEENTQYTLSAYVKNINTTGNGRLSVVYTDGSVDEVVLLNPNTEWAYRSFTTATGKTVALIRTFFGDSGAWYIRGAELMLNKGTTALPYRPYIKRTLTMPEAVKALPDYGVGIPNTDYFNRIRWRYDEPTDKWVREYDRPMKTTNLGTLNWQYGNLFGTGVYCFYAEGATDANNKGTYSIANILCHLYDATTANEIAQQGTTGIALYEKLIVICDTNYTDVASFKSAMSGVILVYALATPEITDISDILPEDNLVGVQAGGTMKAENEFGYDVPMTVTYQIEEEAV